MVAHFCVQVCFDCSIHLIVTQQIFIECYVPGTLLGS